MRVSVVKIKTKDWSSN